MVKKKTILSKSLLNTYLINSIFIISLLINYIYNFSQKKKKKNIYKYPNFIWIGEIYLWNWCDLSSISLGSLGRARIDLAIVFLKFGVIQDGGKQRTKVTIGYGPPNVMDKSH